jgi:hypothetical protein
MASIADDAAHAAPHCAFQIMIFPKRRRSTKAAVKPSDDDVDVAVVEKILLTLRPDLKAKELSNASDMFSAHRDREIFRQEKLANAKASPRKP